MARKPKGGGAKPPADPGGRSRAIVAPPIPAAALVWYGRLFTADDVSALAQAAQRLTMRGGVDAAQVAAALHDAFEAALRRAVLFDRTNVAGMQERAWWRRLERQAADLLGTLGCDPAASAPDAPGVWHLTAAVWSALSYPWASDPVPLGPTIERLLTAADGLPIQGRDVAAAHEAQCKSEAVSLIEQAPRVLDVIAKVAAAATKDIGSGRGGRHQDVLAEELFVRLVRVHRMMFGRGPAWGAARAPAHRSAGQGKYSGLRTIASRIPGRMASQSMATRRNAGIAFGACAAWMTTRWANIWPAPCGASVQPHENWRATAPTIV